MNAATAIRKTLLGLVCIPLVPILFTAALVVSAFYAATGRSQEVRKVWRDKFLATE